MKLLNPLLRFSLFIAIVAVTVYSCSDNNEEVEIQSVSDDTTELAKAAEVDAASASIDDIVIEVFEIDEASALGRSSEITTESTGLPGCVTITVVAQQAFREVTIDFGDQGCLIHGHLLRGQIIFTYTRDINAQEVLVTYDLIDFYFDNKNVLGNRTILRERENDNGNPQYTHSLDLTVIWPNGLQASRSGTKIREWVEGAGSGIFSDNVFEVTGNWTTTFVNGNSHTYTVVTPLRREVICTYFVSGSVDVQRTNFGGTFDYGIGQCDNQATFTFNNGTEIDIILD